MATNFLLCFYKLGFLNSTYRRDQLTVVFLCLACHSTNVLPDSYVVYNVKVSFFLKNKTAYTICMCVCVCEFLYICIYTCISPSPIFFIHSSIDGFPLGYLHIFTIVCSSALMNIRHMSISSLNADLISLWIYAGRVYIPFSVMAVSFTTIAQDSLFSASSPTSWLSDNSHTTGVR